MACSESRSRWLANRHIAAKSHLRQPYAASLERMLILHDRSEQWVFPVEEVLGVHRLPVHDLHSVPSTFGKAGAFSQSVFTWASHTVGYLDETRFLSALRSACK